MKKIHKIIACTAGAAAVICAAVGIRAWLQEQNAGKGYNEIRNEVKADTSAEETDDVEETDPPV